jgi:hypothetical protein
MIGMNKTCNLNHLGISDSYPEAVAMWERRQCVDRDKVAIVWQNNSWHRRMHGVVQRRLRTSMSVYIVCNWVHRHFNSDPSAPHHSVRPYSFYFSIGRDLHQVVKKAFLMN